MENKRESMGYREIQPEGASGRDNPPKENKPNPPVDRPVYTVSKDEIGASNSSNAHNGLNFTALLVAGVIILAIIGTYIYSSDMVRLPVADTSVPKPEPVETGISTSKSSSLKAETVRTITVLEEMETAYSDDPDKLEKVKTLKADARKILESLESEIREE